MATTPALVRRPSRIRLVFSHIFGWELGMSVSSAMSGSEPRRGEHGIAVGKGTRLVPAAHGGRSVRLPDPAGVDGAAKIGVICSVDADGGEAGQWEKPPLRSQALQGREMIQTSTDEEESDPRAMFMTPLQGSDGQRKRGAFIDPGHWPGLGYAAPLGLKATRVRVYPAISPLIRSRGGGVNPRLRSFSSAF